MTTDLKSTLRVHADGTIERGIAVPHEAANIQCHAPLGDGIVCHKRAGHPTPKGEVAHVPVDYRLLAATPYQAHSRRFAPGGIPKGVDLSYTSPGHAAVCGTGEGCPR